MNVIEKLGFVLVVKEDSTYIKLDDVKIDNDTLDDYIGLVGVRNFDKASLHLAIAKGQQTTLRFSKDVVDEFNELMKVDISKDKMEAKVIFYPPSESGKFLTKDDIKTQFKNLDVIFGLKNDVLEEIYDNREYFKEYFVAEGVKPVQGTPAKVDYKFDIKKGYKKEPRIKEDGSLDYNGIDVSNPVHEGDVLAILIPATPGEAGKDISGEDVYPEDLPDVKIYSGNNVDISEDGSEAYAKCDGQAALRSGKIYVDNVYVVQGDVDVVTGDVAFNGDIVVNGNVRTGFAVKAKGSVEINGVVEAADVTAGKNVFIRDGIQGMKRAYIVAGGDVTAKFIESATVYAEGFVEVNSILYSDVTSEKDVTVKGKKAIIVGGVVRSQGKIECDKAGSVMGTSTVLQVGYPDNISDVLDEYVDNIKTTKKKRDEVLKVVKFYKDKIKDKEVSKEVSKEEAQIIKNVVRKAKDLMCELEQITRSYNRTKKLQGRKDLDTDMVVVSNYTYQGVKIEINGATKRITDGISGCIFKKEGKYEIKIFSR